MEGTAERSPCWECRRRRLVCDFTRPKCQKCETRGVACPGYDGKKPLKWLAPQQVNAKGPEKMAVPRAVKPAGERQMSTVLEAIEYYNVHIAPDLVATGASGPGSPYWMPLWTAQFLPRSFIQSMICTSLCHRILQSSDAPPSEQAALARRFQKHRGHALRTLTEDLAQREHQTSDVTLSSVLILLLLELQQSFEPPGWRHHTNGATVMINTKGGLGNLVFSRPYLRHLLRYYTLIEVMGNTTSPHVEIDSARSHLELITILPVLFGNGLATCFPCPPDLLAEVIRINHLRSMFRDMSSPAAADPVVLGEGKHAAALDVLSRIKAFETGKWAAEVAVGISNRENLAGFAEWQAIACIYRSAIAIYCIASLLSDGECPEAYPGGPHLDPRVVLAKTREACRLVLLDRLREVSKCAQLRKLVFWPLFVAGIEAEDVATQQFIAAELRWISHALGTAAPMVAKDLLGRVWGQGLGRGGWECLFDQPYVFVL